MVQVNLNNIYKQYDGDDGYAVHDFNLAIDDQEFIVFVGPSGCGKSTTLRMIAGLEDITEGELYIDDVLMNDVEPKDRGAAMVFQNYALYPHKTVYENMSFSLELRKYSKDEIDERVRRAADVLGLSDHLDRKPGVLSGGQRQRVALGRAIVRDSGLFLMDEPLSNLDAKLRVQMRTEILKLHHRLETTTIYVTHDQTEAMTMADRIVVMKAGYIQQVGRPIDIYDHPENVFVAGFMGSPAMNLAVASYQDGYLTLANNDRIAVASSSRDLLDARGYNGKKVVMGMRPEDIHADNEFFEAHPETIVDAQVNVSELTGSQTYLYVDIGDDEFIAEVGPRDVYAPYEKVKLAFDMEKAHFFDYETEDVIRQEEAYTVQT